ncbi:MAG: preprotein translocase subunit SecE [Planctomycetes bacterium]|nr:preprotein translocase subunit SecE [Planctomycetota bacterium]
MAAFWALIAFLLFGCSFLHNLLVQWESLTVPLGGIRIPVVGVDLTPAFLICFLIFCAGAILIRSWQQRPKVADLLIDTEAELKKVTWPGGQEVWNASIVVIVSVILLGGFLAVADIFLFRLMRYVILGIS